MKGLVQTEEQEEEEYEVNVDTRKEWRGRGATGRSRRRRKRGRRGEEGQRSRITALRRHGDAATVSGQRRSMDAKRTRSTEEI